MTHYFLIHDGVCYTLTDEASQSSYGEPVLVDADGRQYRAGEIVKISDADPVASEWGGWFSINSRREVRAQDIVAGDEASSQPAAGNAFRAPDADDPAYLALTAYGHATAALARRFVAPRRVAA